MAKWVGYALGCLLAFAGLTPEVARAQHVSVGAHVGAVGTTDTSAMGYGAHFNVLPYDWAAFQADFTLASFNGGKYFSSSPAIVLYPVAFEEFSIGLIGGAGFYKLPAVNTKFGVNFGALADFHLTPLVSVGMESRYHSIFDGDSVWNVFLTLNFHFEGDGGW